MHFWTYQVLLFLLTVLGGALPLIFQRTNERYVNLLLAFSGSFLFGVTTLHLLPESFAELGERAGIFILLGFFVQLLLQRISHGVEHGHVHHTEGMSHTLTPIFIGLSVHAFLEGVPLGFNYQQEATLPSIFLGVITHKIPEAITLSGILVVSSISPKARWGLVILFGLVSPLAACLAGYYGQHFQAISSLLIYIIPVVIGSFLHIATTILYESGTRHHELSKQKMLSVVLGIALSLLTLLMHG